MLGSFVSGIALSKLFIIVGSLLILILFIMMVTRGRDSEVLVGGFVYWVGHSDHERMITFDPVRRMGFSIGPKGLLDNHIMMESGSSFKFSVTAEKSLSGDDYIAINCEPPGLLMYRGEIKTSINLYSGEVFVMNKVPIKYINGIEEVEDEQLLDAGKDILKGRI